MPPHTNSGPFFFSPISRPWGRRASPFRLASRCTAFLKPLLLREWWLPLTRLNVFEDQFGAGVLGRMKQVDLRAKANGKSLGMMGLTQEGWCCARGWCRLDVNTYHRRT